MSTIELQPELQELNQVRLEADLTYQQLADEIGVDASALNRLLTDPSKKPHDRTLFKIRRFLDKRRAGADRKGAKAS